MNFHKANETTYADGVDLKRLPRSLSSKGLDPNPDKALEILAQCLGQPNYFALQQLAKQNILVGYDLDEVHRLLCKNAMSEGEEFPKRLPPRFDAAFQKATLKMMDAAMALCQPGALDFVALVGAPSCTELSVVNTS